MDSKTSNLVSGQSRPEKRHAPVVLLLLLLLLALSLLAALPLRKAQVTPARVMKKVVLLIALSVRGG